MGRAIAEDGVEASADGAFVNDRVESFVASLDAERASRGAPPRVEVSCAFSCTLSLDADKASRAIQTVPGVFANAATAPFRALGVWSRVRGRGATVGGRRGKRRS